MKNVSGSTENEVKMIKGVQEAVGAIPDGSIGTQTMSDIACSLRAKCFPLTLTIYGNPVIIAEDILPAAVNAPLSHYANAISGSFSYQKKPCSILVYGNNTVCNSACHAWLDKPESVLYRLRDGYVGVTRAKYTNELPQNLMWAIGGMGLLDWYDPGAEGFTGDYADVLRKTAHTLIGVKNGYIYLAYVYNMTAGHVNAYAKKLGLEKAIMLDGGHVAALNSDEKKINVSQNQFYIVQAIER